MKYENDGSKTYLIRGRYDTTYTKTANEILTYATSQGYNAALLFEYDVNPVAYQILLIGSTGSDLYMYQNNTGSQFGIKNVNYTKHKKNPVWAESSGFTVITGTQTDFSVESVLDGYYRILKYQSWTDPYEPVFISTLSFNKIYLNNQDITPVVNNWEQVFFKNTVFPNYQGTIVNFDCCEDTYINRQGDEQNIAFINQYLTGNLLDSENFPTTETEIYRKGVYSITVVRNGSGPGYEVNWKFKVDNQQLKLAFFVGGNGSHRTKFKIALAINEAEQKGAFVLGELSVNNYAGSVGKESSSIGSANTATNLYNWLKENLPSSYTWQSVTSLKGINDFSISLPVLSNINDGDPVSGASSSAFTKAPSVENNIKNLVDMTLDPVATDNSATIFYTISALKNDSYSSVKVYAKIGEVPKCDETDDIVEDIDPMINEISLENLEFETEYFFCIQSISNNGLKLSSNIESITTGNPIPAEYRQYINLINGCNGEGLDFFWKNYSVTGASRLTAIDNPANFSYVRPTGNWDGNEVIVTSANTSNNLVASSIITLNINKQENDTYKVIVTGYDIAINQNRYAYSFQYSFYTAKNNSLVASNDYVNQYVLDNYWKMGIFVYDFGTLTAALQFLTKNVRNANIYVDGVLWSKANNTN